MFGEIKKQFQINWRDMIFVYVIEIVLVLVGLALEPEAVIPILREILYLWVSFYQRYWGF